MNSRNTYIILAVVIVVVLAVIFLIPGTNQQTGQTSATPPATTQPAPAAPAQ